MAYNDFCILGTYQGQWLRGLRHGYGVRTSAPFGLASSNKLAENRIGNSVSSLNQDSGVDSPATIPEAGGSGASAVGSVTGGPRKTDEIRGGFVLRAKSDEAPSRRRSLVERTGMKTFVQVHLVIILIGIIQKKFGIYFVT
jgi:junctophilin